MLRTKGAHLGPVLVCAPGQTYILVSISYSVKMGDSLCHRVMRLKDTKSRV